MRQIVQIHLLSNRVCCAWRINLSDHWTCQIALPTLESGHVTWSQIPLPILESGSDHTNSKVACKRLQTSVQFITSIFEFTYIHTHIQVRIHKVYNTKVHIQTKARYSLSNIPIFKSHYLHVYTQVHLCAKAHPHSQHTRVHPV